MTKPKIAWQETWQKDCTCWTKPFNGVPDNDLIPNGASSFKIFKTKK